MASNVLPLFWNLASSSKDVRLTASADLIASLEGFQDVFLANKAQNGGDSEDDEEDEDEGDDGNQDEDELDLNVAGTKREKPQEEDEDEDEDEDDDDEVDDEMLGMDVDDSDEEDDDEEEEGAELDAKLAKDNAEDVVYAVKRLVRGLASSRESSRLGFAVALTELLSRMPAVTAPQVISLLIRNSLVSNGMKGTEERDMLFARLFGLSALVQSSALFAPGSSRGDFEAVIDRLIELGSKKGWLRESAWWAVVQASEKLLKSKVAWKEDGLKGLVTTIKEEKGWTQEKVALVLLLEREMPALDLKSVLSPTFKHTPLLASTNLVALSRILKETDVEGDDEGAGSSSTGSWKAQLHFVWSLIFDTYFNSSASDSVSQTGRAPFQDFFRVVVDESLFANTSSPQRRFWGFSVFSRALPLVDNAQMPLLFTPNFMRCWMNNLSSPDRYLHKAALGIAKSVQDIVKENPKVGFTLLSRLVGKHGRPDFDKVTKTKTVESIMSNLSGEGVGEYVKYLQGIILAGENQTGVDAKAIEDRRQWALDQTLALCRNASVPKEDSWISSVLDFLLVHGFFVIRKLDKKSPVGALHAAPKPALSEATAATCRARFFSCLVELTTTSNTHREGGSSAQPVKQQGCDEAGKLWLRRVLKTMMTLEQDRKHVEVMMDADEEIKSARQGATATLDGLKKASGDQAEIARGVEILLSFATLQTYDENEDALDMLEEVNGAARRLFGLADDAEEDDAAPIDVLLDVLIALMDKGSNDLRVLANLVVGMVAPAFTSSSIQHLVAQLESSAASAAAAEGEDDEAEDEDEHDHEHDHEDQAEDDDDDEDVEEDEDEEEAESSEEDIEGDDEDDMAPVDPAFRQRVMDALKSAGMAVEEDAEGDEDDDEDADSEVWDDEQMMKVDEQLVQVFKQQAGRTRRVDLKHLQIESLHFKTRILDLFDVFARKQSTNPLALDIVLPLLRLIRGAGATEGDLANKASGILRNRLGKAKDVPSSTDLPGSTGILEEIHSMARKASSADFSTLCSACSLFVSRAIDTAHPTSRVVVNTYRATLEDWMTRKASLVHPNFISDFLRRFPLRAWPLREDLIAHTHSGKGINAFRQAQAFGMLQIFSQHLSVIAQSQSQSQSTSSEDVAAFVRSASGAVYATLVHAADESGSDWKADRLREVLKFALALARSSKSVPVLSPERVVAAWDLPALRETRDKFAAGPRTGGMKAILLLINQLEAVLGGAKKDKEGKAGKKATKAVKAVNGKKSTVVEIPGEDEQDDKMDVDVDANEQLVSAGAPSQDGKKAKKAKAKSSESKVAAKPSATEDKKDKTKKRKVDAGEKPSKKVKAAP